MNSSGEGISGEVVPDMPHDMLPQPTCPLQAAMPAPFASWALPALLACMVAATLQLPAAHGRTLTQAAPVAPSELAQVESWTWRITAEVAAPDCFERPVLLVNGEAQPKLEVTQGNILEVRLLLGMNIM